MSRTHRPSAAEPTPADDHVARLMSLAGPRATAPEEIKSKVKHAVSSHWQLAAEHEAQRRRFRRRAMAGGLLAAAAALAGFVIAPRFFTPAPAIALGQVEIVRGSVWSSDKPEHLLAVGETFSEGSEIEVADDSALALRLASGASVRLDAGTAVRWSNADTLRLKRGRVYVDSPESVLGALTVTTALGDVREIGTQFEVRLEEKALRVRIREGQVVLEAGETRQTGKAGDEMVWSPDKGLALGRIDLHGPAWAWTLQLADDFELEGAKVEDYLSWLVRETGWRVRFEPPSLGENVAEESVFGSLSGLGPDASPELVLPALGLAYELEEGVLTITPAP